ncbi:heparinase II/III family protein [Arthrobacter sp. Bz4]|uniref:heparinase II/III domain-containing protein n=1 Tax=Arthrobacter sp. Bz4 TaxID=2171979 RepID=UPI001401D666|nr:heparinase II/III family protein [Arthrobacter sp. Bz4]
MGDALRTFELTFALPIFGEKGWLLASLIEHADWLSDEENLGHGNHAFHQHQALFVVASALGLSDKKRLAVERLGALLTSSYDLEGVNEEGSVGYQEQNYRWWLEALRRLKLENVEPPEGIHRLSLAPVALAHATQPNGKYVRIGDIDGGDARAVGSPETDYAYSKGLKGVPPQDLVKKYSAGYVYARSGWGETDRAFEKETFFSFCFGSQAKIHGHQDGGSLTYFAGGGAWLIDTGKYTYGSDPMRSYVLKRSGHNLILLRNRDYDRNTNVTLTREVSTPTHLEYMIRDTGYSGVLISRRVIYSKFGEYLLILDAVSSNDKVTAEQRWHFDPECELSVAGATAYLTQGDLSAQVQWFGNPGKIEVVKGQDNPLDGWTSVGWRKKEPAPVLRSVRSGTQMKFLTLISLSTGQTSEIASYEESEDRAFRLRVESPFGAEHVLVTPKSVAMSLKPFENISTSGEGIPEVVELNSTLELQTLSDDAIKQIRQEGSRLPDRLEVLDPSSRFMIPLSNQGNHGGGLLAAAIDIAGDELQLPSYIRPTGGQRRPIINWNPLKTKTSSGEVRTYASIRQAGQHAYFSGMQTVGIGALTLPIFSTPGPGKVLHVGFHGALNRSKYSLPRFERLTGYSERGWASCLIGDPTLDLSPDLTLGWYLGTHDTDLHRVIADFVMERMEAGGYTEVVLAGSSGGGFAALQIGALIKGSRVAAFNPQTDIRKYYSRFTDLALSSVFGNPRLSDLAPIERLDVGTRIINHKSNTSIYYVQNTGDVFHETRHRQPFSQLVSQTSGVDAAWILEDWGEGHLTPSNDVYFAHLERALGCNLGAADGPKADNEPSA